MVLLGKQVPELVLGRDPAVDGRADAALAAVGDGHRYGRLVRAEHQGDGQVIPLLGNPVVDWVYRLFMAAGEVSSATADC